VLGLPKEVLVEVAPGEEAEELGPGGGGFEDDRQETEATAEERHQQVGGIEEGEFWVAVQELATPVTQTEEEGEGCGDGRRDGEAEDLVGVMEMEDEGCGLAVLGVGLGEGVPVDLIAEAGLELDEIEKSAKGREDAVWIGVGELGVEDEVVDEVGG